MIQTLYRSNKVSPQHSNIKLSLENCILCWVATSPETSWNTCDCELMDFLCLSLCRLDIHLQRPRWGPTRTFVLIAPAFIPSPHLFLPPLFDSNKKYIISNLIWRNTTVLHSTAAPSFCKWNKKGCSTTTRLKLHLCAPLYEKYRISQTPAKTEPAQAWVTSRKTPMELNKNIRFNEHPPLSVPYILFFHPLQL